MSFRIKIATPPTPRPGYSLSFLTFLYDNWNPYFMLFPDFSLLSFIVTNVGNAHSDIVY